MQLAAAMLPKPSEEVTKCCGKSSYLFTILCHWIGTIALVKPDTKKRRRAYPV